MCFSDHAMCLSGWSAVLWSSSESDELTGSSAGLRCWDLSDSPASLILWPGADLVPVIFTTMLLTNWISVWCELTSLTTSLYARPKIWSVLAWCFKKNGRRWFTYICFAPCLKASNGKIWKQNRSIEETNYQPHACKTGDNVGCKLEEQRSITGRLLWEKWGE